MSASGSILSSTTASSDSSSIAPACKPLSTSGSTPARLKPALFAPGDSVPSFAPAASAISAANARTVANASWRPATLPSRTSALSAFFSEAATPLMPSPESNSARPAPDRYVSTSKKYSCFSLLAKLTLAPACTALRTRCAMIGASWRRFDPMTKMASWFSISAISQPSQGKAGSLL